MVALIDKRATGINLRLIMDKKDLTVRDLQQYLGLCSPQSIYHWLNGICLPTLDNLYALSELFRMPLDDLICGSRACRPLRRIFWQDCAPEHGSGERIRFFYNLIQGL